VRNFCGLAVHANVASAHQFLEAGAA
jgi:hypothetical protein